MPPVDWGGAKVQSASWLLAQPASGSGRHRFLVMLDGNYWTSPLRFLSSNDLLKHHRPEF
jgi:hypothetical protein